MLLLKVQIYNYVLGQLSEEAAEACNKLIRKYRLQFTAKISRLRTNSDLMNRLLISSDPFISTMRKKQTKKHRPLSDEVLQLLKSHDDEANVASQIEREDEDQPSDDKDQLSEDEDQPSEDDNSENDLSYTESDSGDSDPDDNSDGTD